MFSPSIRVLVLPTSQILQCNTIIQLALWYVYTANKDKTQIT